MSRRHYIALITQDHEGGPYGVFFPDFDGCIAVEDTIEAVMESAADVLAMHIDGMVEDGEDIPAPSSRTDIDAGKDIVALVPVTLPGRTVRKNISIDEDLWNDIAAREKNVSGFLAKAAREKLYMQQSA